MWIDFGSQLANGLACDLVAGHYHLAKLGDQIYSRGIGGLRAQYLFNPFHHLTPSTGNGHAVARLEPQTRFHSKGGGAANHMLDCDTIHLSFQYLDSMSAGS